MTGSKCLVDTSIIVHSFRQKSIIPLRLHEIEEVYVPVIVVGELYFGAYNTENIDKHIDLIKTFLSNSKILHIDLATTGVYGEIKSRLRKIGKPLPENDIWIAAIAIKYDLPIYTTDNHFKEIPEIRLF